MKNISSNYLVVLLDYMIIHIYSSVTYTITNVIQLNSVLF